MRRSRIALLCTAALCLAAASANADTGLLLEEPEPGSVLRALPAVVVTVPDDEVDAVEARITAGERSVAGALEHHVDDEGAVRWTGTLDAVSLPNGPAVIEARAGKTGEGDPEAGWGGHDVVLDLDPPKPAVAADVKDGDVVLTWEPSVAPDLIGYTVARAHEEDAWTELAVRSADETGWTDAAPDPGTFRYRVTALRPGADGLTRTASVEVEAVVPEPPAPPPGEEPPPPPGEEPPPPPEEEPPPPPEEEPPPEPDDETPEPDDGAPPEPDDEAEAHDDDGEPTSPPPDDSDKPAPPIPDLPEPDHEVRSAGEASPEALAPGPHEPAQPGAGAAPDAEPRAELQATREVAAAPRSVGLGPTRTTTGLLDAPAPQVADAEVRPSDPSAWTSVPPPDVAPEEPPAPSPGAFAAADRAGTLAVSDTGRPPGAGGDHGAIRLAALVLAAVLLTAGQRRRRVAPTA